MTDQSDIVIVAADGGGTGCRAAAGTLARGPLGQAEGGPGNVHSDFDGAIARLTAAVDAALAQARLAGTAHAQITAHFGVAGAHSEAEMAAVAAALPYGRTTVTGDRATSVRGVLGTADGYVVALGTGTIVARQEALHMRTVGGWGFDLSDQASGAWLGRRLLQQIVLAEDGLTPHTDLSQGVLQRLGGLVPMIHHATGAAPSVYAKLARDVIGAATDGDAMGRALMAEGAAYVQQALDRLGFAAGDPLALAGGVGPHYAAYLEDRYTADLRKPEGSALDGAFAMACQSAQAGTG